MTGVHLERNRQVYSVEGADAVIYSNSYQDLSSGPRAQMLLDGATDFGGIAR